MTTLIDLDLTPKIESNNLEGLRAYLTQLIGEPFQFVRFSYGDELTLHFGTLKPAKSPKLKGKVYGSYVLGVLGVRGFSNQGRNPSCYPRGLTWTTSPMSSANR